MLSPHAEWVRRVDILLTCAPREKRCEKKVGPRGSPRPHGSGGWGVVRAIVAGIAGVFLALTASAHDPERGWDDWFVLQRNMRGGSCCNLSHAHYLKDEDWRNG